MKDLFRSRGGKGKPDSNEPAETELNEQDLEQVTGAHGGDHYDYDDCDYDDDDYCHRHHHHRHHHHHHHDD